nr:sulfite exporter TauE/SafE family protein [Hoeflea prorocentri]
MPTEFYVVAAVAVLLTGLSKSGFGGGLGIMAVPLMSLFVAPQFAAATMMPILLAMDIIIVWRYRHDWSAPVVRLLLPGAIIGLGAGALAFHHVDAALIRFAVGLLALSFVAQYVLSRRRYDGDRAARNETVLALGAVSGFASFIAHAGGPPVKGFLLRKRLEKSAFVGTNTIFFFLLNATKAVAYGALGHYSAESLGLSLTLSPILVLGVLIGFKLHGLIDQTRFTAVVYTLLAVTGSKLVWDSVPLLLQPATG